jgi:hypothetical protein
MNRVVTMVNGTGWGKEIFNVCTDIIMKIYFVKKGAFLHFLKNCFRNLINFSPAIFMFFEKSGKCTEIRGKLEKRHGK